MLQTACDIMADAVSTLGGVTRKTPFESFHKLNQWAVHLPGRVKLGFQLLSSELPWFSQINGVRTKLVHRGGDVWVFTNRSRFEWDVRVGNDRVRRGTYLLSSIQGLTRSMLEYSKVLAEGIMLRRELQQFPKQ